MDVMDRIKPLFVKVKYASSNVVNKRHFNNAVK